MLLHLDCETRSTTDLKTVGVYRYATDPSTDVLCAAFRLDAGPIWLWRPGDPVPKTIISAIRRGLYICAWNAQFERLIWWNILAPRYGWPRPELEQFWCVAAQARAMGFPGKLEHAARFAGLPESLQKDVQGHRLMLKMCRPRRMEHGRAVWWEDKRELQQLYKYCQQDVAVECALHELLRPLPPDELNMYHLTERLNDRGVRLDTGLVEHALRTREAGTREATARLRQLTRNAVTSVSQIARLQAWLERRGVTLPDLRQDTVDAALESTDLSPDAREVLELRQEHGRASVSKFEAMRNRVQDDVLRGLFVYAGAPATGRFSSVGVQLHNLMRASATPEEVAAFLRGEQAVPLPKLVRPALIPARGKVFGIADYTSIEAIVLPWLASRCGISSADDYLARWRRQEPVYEQQAAAIYGMPVADVTKDQRQVGKIATLALGFGGGANAFLSMARAYGIDVSESEAETIKTAWRAANRWAPRFWRLLDETAIAAFTHPGAVRDLGALAFLYHDQHLWCRLPSGRLLCYPFAKLDERGVLSYRRGNRAPKQGASGWPRVDLYGGLLAENVTQAVANDVLRCAIVAIESRRKKDIVLRLHVHDELVVELPKAKARQLLPTFTKLALSARHAAWAEGLPLFVKASVADRYGKQ